MPDWLIWLLVGIFVASCGRGCHVVWRHRSLENPGDLRRRLEDPEARGPEDRGRRGPEDRGRRRLHSGPAAIAPTAPESRLQELQRKYVEGLITVEEYEAELDRLHGLR
ncbi:MAG: hypothetical protein ACE5JR_10605 [Gemmatimonadota bacterium]